MSPPSNPPPPIDGDPGVRILVVDDEPAIRHLLKRWIHRAFSIDIAEAANGLQALETLTTGKFDLVITDLNMPVLDGIEMLSLIRADSSHAQLEVMVATAVGSEEKVRAAISMGVSDYLLKPLQYDLVLARLEAAISRVTEKRSTQAEEVDHSRTRVLIADRDPNFCEFARASLENQFAVSSARTTAETLVQVLRWKPDAIVMGRNLNGANLDFLVEKIRTVARPNKIAVYVLGDSDSEKPDCEVEGVVRRTFVPESFCSEIVSKLRGGEAPAHGILAWIPSLEPEVTTAVRQSLGMLVGGEPNELTEFRPSAPPDYFAKIELHGDAECIWLRLAVQASHSFAASIVLAMIGGQESDLDEESKRSGIKEILNVVAGRINNSCEHRQIDLKLGLPEFGDAEFGGLKNAIYQKKFIYQWQETEPFELLLSAATGKAPDSQGEAHTGGE